MKPFTKFEKSRIKEAYGSLKEYRAFLFNEIRFAKHLFLDGNPFHLEVMKCAEKLYLRSFLKTNK